MQFQKGQGGNPAGRPRGPRNKASIRMQEMLEQKVDELVEKLVQIALAGNIGALRVCLDRLLRQQTSLSFARCRAWKRPPTR